MTMAKHRTERKVAHRSNVRKGCLVYVCVCVYDALFGYNDDRDDEALTRWKRSTRTLMHKK